MKQKQWQMAKSNGSKGIALISVLLLLLILSAAAVALMYTVNTEVHLQKTDQGSGMAYYGAEAGKGKKITGFNNLFNLSPFPPTTPPPNGDPLTQLPPAPHPERAAFFSKHNFPPTCYRSQT